MIVYLKNHQIDREKWDYCISNAINGNIYAYSWYLDVLSPSWEALITEDYKQVFPLVWKKKFNTKYIFRPYLIQNLGLFSSAIVDANTLDKFIQNIPKEFKLIDIYFNKYNKLNRDSYSVNENITYELDLIEPYEKLYKNYSDNTKRNIKKAIQDGITIVKNANPKLIINLFKENRGKDLNNIREDEYNNLQKLVYLLLLKNKLHIRAACNNRNEICAGVFFAESHQKVIFLFSATNEYARNNGAMSLIIDQFIKENALKSITLDFEGSNIKNLARFYRSFGSKEFVYLQIQINRLSFGFKQLAQIYQRLRKLMH